MVLGPPELGPWHTPFHPGQTSCRGDANFITVTMNYSSKPTPIHFNQTYDLRNFEDFDVVFFKV